MRKTIWLKEQATRKLGLRCPKTNKPKYICFSETFAGFEWSKYLDWLNESRDIKQNHQISCWNFRKNNNIEPHQSSRGSYVKKYSLESHCLLFCQYDFETTERNVLLATFYKN